MSFTLWITYGASLTPDVIETGSLAEILLSASGYTGEGYEDAHVDIFEPGATRPTAFVPPGLPSGGCRPHGLRSFTLAGGMQSRREPVSKFPRWLLRKASPNSL